jgi:myo-inositol-1(or 4)-monophosphatase
MDIEPDASEFEELRQFAVSAAELAAESADVLAMLGHRGRVALKPRSTELISGTDLALDRVLRDRISSRWPHHGLVSEESEATTGAGVYRWVVDPLDGTTNFVLGLAHFCVSLACEWRLPNGEWGQVAAAVHDPVRRETFSAARGSGAYLGAGRLNVSAVAELSHAVVATELSYGVDGRIRQLEQMGQVAPLVRDIRMMGSSALDLCWIAAGRLDGFWEDELGRWDWSAGALIVSEAGGRFTPWGTGVVAGGVAVHDALTKLLDYNGSPLT